MFNCDIIDKMLLETEAFFICRTDWINLRAVAIQRLTITEYLAKSKGALVLDVRSPGEYQHAHMPGAHSMPLFTDEERKVVGTAYKQQSREEAIKIGLDYFGPKMRKMVEEAESLIHSLKSEVESEPLKKEVFVYCWRGGMRSAGVAWLLDLYGFKVFTLAGGYKAFRNYVLQTFTLSFPLRIIGGYTGSGKTEVLKELERWGQVTIDLEGIACHKGSAFGSYKMPPQPRQEMFENQLALELQKALHTINKAEAKAEGLTEIWLEDESQRIGDLNLPSALWKAMRIAPVVFLEIPFEERLNHLVEEYSTCDKEKLKDSVQRISQRLGGLAAKNTLAFLEEDNFKEAFRILLAYYDKYYLKGLHNRESLSSLLTKIQCPAPDPKNAQLLLTKHPTA
jgi:tRNA 2-selenouridine synthase